MAAVEAAQLAGGDQGGGEGTAEEEQGRDVRPVVQGEEDVLQGEFPSGATVIRAGSAWRISTVRNMWREVAGTAK
ncbi:hypothetical protein ACFVZJ_31445 [Streptomyces sp. NPDC058322]|uniref:hypothetical protein n=1 Tax=unclassified Streptomyces TaxID=2593676 RepID=UPI0033F820A3